MPQSDNQYVTISDFRPGIVDADRFGTASVRAMPLGSAVRVGQGTLPPTSNCIAHQYGQLQALSSFVVGPNITPNSVLTNTPFTVGLTAVGPLVSAAGSLIDDDIHMFFEGNIAAAGGTNVMEWWVLKPNAVAWARIKTFSGFTGTGNRALRGITTIFTRGRNAAPFTTIGNPILCVEWTSGVNAVIGAAAAPWKDTAVYFYDVYPDPGAPNTDVPFEETNTVNAAAARFGGQLVAHAGRILRLCETSTDFGAGFVQVANERVRFTDPPNSISLASSATDSFFDAEIPGGYGAWGSISFGELILIKRKGGALLIEGDVYAPSVTRLAGVKSTGNMTAPALATPSGLVYAVQNDGIYLWNGGSESQKINKVDDSLFLGTVTMNSGVTTSMAYWNNLVVFRNGIVWDPLNDSWWVMPSPFTAARPIYWLASGVSNTDRLYAITDGILVGGAIEYATIYPANQAPAANAPFTWCSQPLPVSVSNTIDVHEVIITASNVKSASQTVTVKLQTLDGTSLSESFVFAAGTGGVQSVRMPMGIRGNCIQIGITVPNVSDENMIINSLSVGYGEAAPYGQTA